MYLFFPLILLSHFFLSFSLKQLSFLVYPLLSLNTLYSLISVYCPLSIVYCPLSTTFTRWSSTSCQFRHPHLSFFVLCDYPLLCQFATTSCSACPYLLLTSDEFAHFCLLLRESLLFFFPGLPSSVFLKGFILAFREGRINGFDPHDHLYPWQMALNDVNRPKNDVKWRQFSPILGRLPTFRLLFSFGE